MLRLAISPCPNDTFAFYGLLHGKTAWREPLHRQFADIEELNRLCLLGEIDFCKISFHAFVLVQDRYRLLESGSALGFGCGPLIVAHPGTVLSDLKRGRIAVPGLLTTATLLLKLLLGKDLDLVPMRFDAIMPAVADGSVAGGLIIHESRFTFQDHGLISLIDLGDWWEKEQGHPIPLGGIVARKNLPPSAVEEFDKSLNESIRYAWEHYDETIPFMSEHAREMDPRVMRKHVDLYVNRFTLGLGERGRSAIAHLVKMARTENITAPENGIS